MDIATLRKRYAGFSDDEIVAGLRATQYQDFSEQEVKDALGIKPPKRTWAAVANDTVIEAANAAAGVAGAAANFVSPGNRFSGFIDEEIIKKGEASQSDAVKAEKAKMRSEMEAAEGFGEEALAAGKYVVRNPGLAAAQAVGSFAGPGLAIKGVQGAAAAARAAPQIISRAGLGAGAAVGAAGAGGDAAGTAYELAKRAGATEDEAVAAARQASVLPAIVGAAGGLVGAERAFAGASGFTGGAVKRALKTGVTEAAQEGFEEGITQYEGQRAAVPFDPKIDPMKGVGGAATMGAALGGITGAGTGLLSRRPPTEEELRGQALRAKQAAADAALGQIGAAPDADAAVEAFSRATDVPLEIPPTAAAPAFGTAPDLSASPRAANAAEIAEIRQLDQADQKLALDLRATARNPKSPPGSRRSAQNQLDALLLGVRQPPVAEATELAPEVADTGPLSQPPASLRERTDALRSRTRAMAERFGQAGPIPTGAVELEAQEMTLGQAAEAVAPRRQTEARPVPAGEATELAAEQVEPAPGLPLAPERAARTPRQDEPADVVRRVIDGLRGVNTMQARRYVQEFEAGRVTPQDVLDFVGWKPMPREETERRLAAAADEGRRQAAEVNDRLDRAAAQAPRAGQSLLLTGDGMPYGTRAGATARATREGGGAVIEVPGGWAVRPKEGTQDATAGQPPAVPPGGAGAGRGAEPAGGAGNLAAGEGLVRVGGDAAAPDRRIEPAAAVADAGRADAALTTPAAAADFTAGMSATRARAVNMALDNLLPMPGAERTRRQEVASVVAAGGKVKKGRDGKRSLGTGARRLTETQIGRTAMDYAEWLLGQRETGVSGQGVSTQRDSGVSTNVPLSAMERFYESLLAKKSTKQLTSSGGRTLYEVQVTPSMRTQHQVRGRFPESAGFELRRKEEVTGQPSDDGYILIDKREQVRQRAPTQQEASDAAQAVRDQGGLPGEREGRDRRRQAADAGRGDRLQREAQGQAEENAEQPAAAPVAESQAPGRSADGEGGAAPTRAGGGPQLEATHADPGEAAEPVSKAVVGEAIAKGAKREERSPSAMKADLLRQIDEAIPAAKYEKRDDVPRGSSVREGNYVSFEVPGDGAFEVMNARDALSEFRRKVETSPGFKTKQSKPTSEREPTVERGSSSAETAIRAMIDEGDPQAAVDYAATKDIDLREMLKGDRVRLPKVAGLEPTREAPATEPAPEPAPAPPPTADPFTGDYDSLVGKTITLTVPLDDGRTATMRVDAAAAMRDSDRRLRVLSELRACLGRAG